MAETPRGTRIYAIGDIHGHNELLAPLIDAIADDAERDPPERAVLICIGDYVDRGPDSKGVVATLCEKVPGRFETVFLKGNHEAMMLEAMTGSARDAALWVMNGGRETLESYGINLLTHPLDDTDQWDMSGLAASGKALARAMPERDRTFFEGLRLLHREGDYLFVHAGIRPGTPLDRQDPDDLIWIRYEFLDSRADHGVVVVHGHTPRPWPEERRNRIGIDTGAYRTGVLTAVVLDGAARRFIHSDANSGIVVA